MTIARTMLAASAGLPAFVLSQPNAELEPGATWTYMSRPGETVSLTIVEKAAPGIVLNGERATRYRVYASGFRSFSSPPTRDPASHAACVYLTIDVFDSLLANHVGRRDLEGIDPCEALSGRTFSSLEQVIDSIERPVVPAPRTRPEQNADQREVSDLVEPVNHCVVVYPQAAATAKQEGWVRIEFVVSTEGMPTEPRVVDSSPPGIFEAAALEGISKCRFRPLTMDGESVPIEGALLDISFEL